MKSLDVEDLQTLMQKTLVQGPSVWSTHPAWLPATRLALAQLSISLFDESRPSACREANEHHRVATWLRTRSLGLLGKAWWVVPQCQQQQLGVNCVPTERNVLSAGSWVLQHVYKLRRQAESVSTSKIKPVKTLVIIFYGKGFPSYTAELAGRMNMRIFW